MSARPVCKHRTRPPGAPRVGALLVALALGTTTANATSALRTAPLVPVGKQSLVVYSVATGVQYVNNADDEARGIINNPFNASTNKMKPNLNFKGDGPFAGDVTVFSFNVFKDQRLTGKEGSAQITCYYNYNLEAFCQAYYLFKDSSILLASGPVNFNKTGFTLIITGGTDRFLGVRGELIETGAGQNGQRLDFVLVGAP